MSASVIWQFEMSPVGPIDWGGLAGAFGYFDQARTGHELRAFARLTPTWYVEVRRRFPRESPGYALDGRPLLWPSDSLQGLQLMTR